MSNVSQATIVKETAEINSFVSKIQYGVNNYLNPWVSMAINGLDKLANNSVNQSTVAYALRMLSKYGNADGRKTYDEDTLRGIATQFNERGATLGDRLGPRWGANIKMDPPLLKHFWMETPRESLYQEGILYRVDVVKKDSNGVVSEKVALEETVSGN